MTVEFLDVMFPGNDKVGNNTSYVISIPAIVSGNDKKCLLMDWNWFVDIKYFSLILSKITITFSVKNPAIIDSIACDIAEKFELNNEALTGVDKNCWTLKYRYSTSVGIEVGLCDNLLVGCDVVVIVVDGTGDGNAELGWELGRKDGLSEGKADDSKVGYVDGSKLGCKVELSDGKAVGSRVGYADGSKLGSEVLVIDIEGNRVGFIDDGIVLGWEVVVILIEGTLVEGWQLGFADFKTEGWIDSFPIGLRVDTEGGIKALGEIVGFPDGLDVVVMTVDGFGVGKRVGLDIGDFETEEVELYLYNWIPFINISDHVDFGNNG